MNEPAHNSRAPLAASPKHDAPATLEHLRQDIDQIDEKIVDLLAQRLEKIRSVVALKKARGLPIYHPAREEDLISQRREQARRVGEVPGVVIPDAVYERLSAYSDPSDQAKVGQEIAIEQILQVRREGWSGLYLMSPATHRPVLEVLRGGLA